MTTRLREAAEDLRDASTKCCAAIIGDRLEDAAYTFNALILDTVEEVQRELLVALSTKGPRSDA
jgi:hypothetical protein